MRVWCLVMVSSLHWTHARAADGPMDISLHGSVATLVTDTPLGFAMVDARVPIGSRFLAIAGLAHLDPSGPREEQQLRLSLTGTLPIARYSFDDRLLWVRSDTNVEYWRNRWRISAPLGARFSNTRRVLFDELYYNESRGFFRNVVAAGASITGAARITSDVLYMYFDNRHGEANHGVLFMVSMRFH